MAVELARSPVVNYKPVSRGLSVANPARLDRARAISLRIAFQTSMERALLNQKYWEELLEKLRKAGGGGGGNDSRFDRIAVSMMLTNFLSNKTIRAMLKNFGGEFLNIDNNIPNQSQGLNQNVFMANVQKLGDAILNGVTNIISLIVRRDVPLVRLYNVALVGILSFQLNKLRAILQEEFKETVSKLDIKEKIKKIKIALTDFFVEMKDEIFKTVDFFKSCLGISIESFFVKNS